MTNVISKPVFNILKIPKFLILVQGTIYNISITVNWTLSFGHYILNQILIFCLTFFVFSRNLADDFLAENLNYGLIFP